MIYTLRISRRKLGEAESYWQSFSYETEKKEDTVASALTRLNEEEDLRDTEGKPARRITWKRSCLQKKCGACAMVINGRPGLACDARLAELGGSTIQLEPLRKFPVVEDLRVDRSILMRNLAEMRLWLTKNAELHDEDQELAYMASECIQCGCCLEICPNFYAGGRFFGMAVVPVTTRLLTELPKESYRAITEEYARHSFAGCGKSLACRDICPRGIDTEELLVNANAMAVWKRKRKKKK